jgi:hypothetical protein
MMNSRNELVTVFGRVRSDNKVGAHNPFLTPADEIVEAMLITLGITVENIDVPFWYRYEVERSISVTMWQVDMRDLQACQNAEPDNRLHWRNYQMWFDFDTPHIHQKPLAVLAHSKKEQ